MTQPPGQMGNQEWVVLLPWYNAMKQCYRGQKFTSHGPLGNPVAESLSDSVVNVSNLARRWARSKLPPTQKTLSLHPQPSSHHGWTGLVADCFPHVGGRDGQTTVCVSESHGLHNLVFAFKFACSLIQPLGQWLSALAFALVLIVWAVVCVCFSGPGVESTFRMALAMLPS